MRALVYVASYEVRVARQNPLDDPSCMIMASHSLGVTLKKTIFLVYGILIDCSLEILRHFFPMEWKPLASFGLSLVLLSPTVVYGYTQDIVEEACEMITLRWR